MNRLRITLILVSVLPAMSGRAGAQTVGASAYGAFGTVVFAAHDTFEAIAGSSTKAGFGVGGTVSHLWKSVYVDVSFWQHKVDGERVFVDGGTVFPLGIPLEVTVRPFDVIGGWRFDARPVQPFVGAGATFLSYKETSDFSIASDDVNERKAGLVLLAGLDISVSRLVRVGGEFRYRSVASILGAGGASEAFGEDQLGGAAFAVRASVGR